MGYPQKCRRRRGGGGDRKAPSSPPQRRNPLRDECHLRWNSRNIGGQLCRLYQPIRRSWIMPTHRGCSRRWNACCTARKAAAGFARKRKSTISVWKRRTRRFPAFRGRITASRRRCSASSRMTCALTSRISSCITRRTAAMSARFSARRSALTCRISPLSARAWMCSIPRPSAPAWAASSSCGCMSMMIFRSIRRSSRNTRSIRSCSTGRSPCRMCWATFLTDGR